MPITAAELKLWGPVSNPEDDSSVSGGAIQDDASGAGGVVLEFVDISAADTVEVLSDGADTRTVTVYGRLANGTIDNEVFTLSGTTPQNGAKTFERILKVVLSVKDAARTVTVRKASDNVTIFSLGINTKEGRRRFYAAASAAGEVNRYESGYIKNHNGTLALQAAALKLTGDPASRLKMAVSTSKGDISTVTNRITAPAGGGLVGGAFVDDNVSVAVPSGFLGAGERISGWLEQKLPGADGPQKNSWTVEISGNTT